MLSVPCEIDTPEPHPEAGSLLLELFLHGPYVQSAERHMCVCGWDQIYSCWCTVQCIVLYTMLQ